MPKDPIKAAEYRKKLSESNRNRWKNLEFKNKMCNSTKDRWSDPEFKNKMINLMNTPKEKQKKITAMNTPEAKKKMSIAQTKRYENIEERKKSSKIKIKFYKDHPEVIKNYSESMKKYFKNNPEEKKRMGKILNSIESRQKGVEKATITRNTPEGKKRMSEALKKHHEEHPETKEKMSEILKKHYNDNPEKRKLSSELMKKYHKEHPEVSKKCILAMHTIESKKKSAKSVKKYWDDNPEARKKHSVAQKKRFEKTEEREKTRNGTRKVWLDSRWYGNVVYYDSPQYCEKFKTVKPKIHIFFKKTCVECGEIEIKTEHHVHHVFYDKMACCLEDHNGVYYSNLNAKNHREKNYCIGRNPNYFVLLCHGCHTKTNGNFERRKFWANHFKELIDTKYGGVCY